MLTESFVAASLVALELPGHLLARYAAPSASGRQPGTGGHLDADADLLRVPAAATGRPPGPATVAGRPDQACRWTIPISLYTRSAAAKSNA
jgi:hypothetical protein